MSKKKSLTTMTLKDFHGGSIPSDLSLPSAPGLNVRSTDRAAGATTGARVDQQQHRSRAAMPDLRPTPSPQPFLSPPTTRIVGSHFDEDERTPFDGSRRVPPVQPQPRMPQISTLGAAWSGKRDASVPAPPGVWSGERLFSQTSDAEKVISGRWHSSSVPVQQPVAPLALPTSQLTTETGALKFAEMERPRSEGHLTGKERLGSVVSEDANERSRPASHEARVREGTERHNAKISLPTQEGHMLHQPAKQPLKAHLGINEVGRAGEPSERPKLSLLPRTKPLETPEIREVTEKMVHQLPENISPVETLEENHGNPNSAAVGIIAAESVVQLSDRPRLNLKPRSRPVEEPDQNTVKERQTVFGGARPRELVLKERGVDVIPNDLDKSVPSVRARSGTELALLEGKVEPAADRKQRAVENAQPTQRNAWPERRTLPQLLLESSSSKRASKDFERQTLSQPRPEPDTWRKPVEQLVKPESSHPRFGKTATALELAQAFSKPASTSAQKQNTNPRPVQGRSENQVRFSRLADPVRGGSLYSGMA